MNTCIDTYNRRINYLRISITDRCNLRCLYCMPKEGVSLIGHNDILSYEEFLRIAHIVAGMGVSKIRITGGEPLVRRDIVSFVRSLHTIEGITDLSITTNGIMLQSAAGPLRQAGLKRINISLDSLDPQKYREITRGGDIQSALAGIRQARIAGYDPIKINVVVMRGVNDDEIGSFAKLTLDRSVHIRFIEFMPVDVKTRWDPGYFIPNADVQRAIEEFGPLKAVAAANNGGPAQMFQLPGALGKLGFISPLSNHFCESCNRLRLTADGKLRTCLFSDEETNLKTPLRQGCSDADLRDLIAVAVRAKPKHHTVTEPTFKKCLRGMSAIGG